METSLLSVNRLLPVERPINFNKTSPMRLKHIHSSDISIVNSTYSEILLCIYGSYLYARPVSGACPGPAQQGVSMEAFVMRPSAVGNEFRTALKLAPFDTLAHS